MSQPAILVNAFNRPHSLRRLLESLVRASIPVDTQLVISIDGGGDPAVRQFAEDFLWPFGEKLVSAHRENLGLVAHFLYCGGLTRSHGDIIYLEDDLVVSRRFYAYARSALETYRSDVRVAGISLNRLRLNGYTQLPFEPVLDDSDVFFAQVYWYQGQVYTPRMWTQFETWWQNERRPITLTDGLHPLFLPHKRWQDDFFPDAMHYLNATGRFFVFPRESHTTLFGDPGTHFTHATDVFQVPLQNIRADFRLPPLSDALAVYDSFFELLPDKFTGSLPLSAFDVDLNGTKPPEALRRPYTLTTRPVHAAKQTFALRMHPPEMNVLEAVPGTGISLAKADQVRRSRISDWITAHRLRRFHARGQFSLRQAIADRVAGLLDRSG